MIRATLEQIQQIRAHAENTYPEECCGLLIGKIEGENKILIEVIATENSWDAEAAEFLSVEAGSKRNRFSIAPEVLLRVQKETRDRNLSIIGIYHSHPDHPAIPSEFDRAIAWQQYSYMIISLSQGRAVEIRSWFLDENRQFKPENNFSNQL
ncbi:MAG: M67 family metallopeptidase [Hydrococcus sp. C42_A2020_068]|uniref:Mov34/MPN/PAD-1 family protein n=1 Tax=Pleurocapsa sp. PCC 7327 TaxID=118163 RepID=UPI00029FEABE|nr:M67 family metallopeptidase [Pleurocapsa sp. PCC 7327]AFY76015.1 putative metal-dependent protease of the PAD1/JAB1 superfamily [Pleurocapsa sp. PCC 7327]MBF2021881.1 M67 family metallopeptidase [Hydrococcus sp. C42_A2020_068]